MRTLDEGALSFTFADGWIASKYDEWDFYRKTMENGFGLKGVDFVAVSPEGIVHLIEVKDYRHPEHSPVPLMDLPDEISRKCLDTMTGLFLAGIQATDPKERHFAQRAAGAKQLRVTFHMMLKPEAGRLSNPDQVRANLQAKLKMKIGRIDPHARVMSTGYPWEVGDRSFHPKR